MLRAFSFWKSAGCDTCAAGPMPRPKQQTSWKDCSRRGYRGNMTGRTDGDMTGRQEVWKILPVV